MESYISRYDQFDNVIVYDFNLGDGGIGDCIKFFMFVLEKCIKNNTRLYYKRNNIEIEKYIKLVHEKMYITEDSIDGMNIVRPQYFYATITYDYSIPFQDVFYFTEEVKINRDILMPPNITNYISIHLRLGDKYLETDKKFVLCVNDERDYSEEEIHKVIENNPGKNIFFCCDNRAYKRALKEKYENIIITDCAIGHTSLSNTTQKQVLDSVTEFYILTNSDMIYISSFSGFSMVAAKFKNIPINMC